MQLVVADARDLGGVTGQRFDAVLLMGAEPSIGGASWHLLYMGRKRDG